MRWLLSVALGLGLVLGMLGGVAASTPGKERVLVDCGPQIRRSVGVYAGVLVRVVDPPAYLAQWEALGEPFLEGGCLAQRYYHWSMEPVVGEVPRVRLAYQVSSPDMALYWAEQIRLAQDARYQLATSRAWACYLDAGSCWP